MSGRRRRIQWPFLIALTVVWVLLWGSVTVASVLAGVAVAVIVMVVFPLPPVIFGGRVRLAGLARLAGWFVVDLVIASAQVSWLALRVGQQPSNTVVQVDLKSRSDLYLTLTAELLSLVPGSIVLEARRSTATLYLHVLGVAPGDEAGAEDARRRSLRQEERVLNALASDEELAAYRHAIEGRPA